MPTIRDASSTAAKRPGASLRALPPVHELLEGRRLQEAASRHGRELVAALLRERLATIRDGIRKRTMSARTVQEAVGGLEAWVEGEAGRRLTSSLRPVINATGVLLHTNLGRALLPETAVRRIAEVARAYTTLEYDLDRGRRGSRSTHLTRILSLLFPGRSAQVVNNNAAAVLLALNTLAEGKEVIVSRGELVEIGGSFRIPDIMRKSGAILREVGTTNKTKIQDYERAIGPRTGLLLKVHPSNYRIVGFTAQVALQDLAALARRRRIPLLMDQGSGNMLDLGSHGVRDEPSVRDALSRGADVVCCSGDKLLGGPQAGLLIGRPKLIRRISENPLMRVLRVDKMTYAALEATLTEYIRGAAEEELPVIKMIAAPASAIEARARRLAGAVAARAGGRLVLAVIPGSSLLGAGSAPEEPLPSSLLTIRSPNLSARALGERLRQSPTPIIARIEGNQVLIDLRTVLEVQDRQVEAALVAIAAGE